jgi:DNA-3-methyladenine glycosylase II
MAQQVSGAAASSIKRKFIDLFPAPTTSSSDEAIEPTLPEKPEKHFPTPAQVVEKDVATLRTAGLSQRKAEYIHGLAEKFVSGELSAKMLIDASDEEVLEKLVAVRGLGRWSVEMFACFALKRTDIFSTGDLGVQ